MSTFGKPVADKRPCVFCGKPIGAHLARARADDAEGGIAVERHPLGELDGLHGARALGDVRGGCHAGDRDEDEECEAKDRAERPFEHGR